VSLTLQTAAAGLMLACAFGASAQPLAMPRLRSGRQDWMDRPDATLYVRWIRVDDYPQAEVRDGVCVLYMADRREQDLDPAETLIRSCIERGAHDVPAPGAIRLNWHRMPDKWAVTKRFGETFGVQRVRVPALGFYVEAEDGCHVVTSDKSPSLGHELKHCFDGAFHDHTGRWFTRPTKETQ
jgi:hypothetical protein